MLATCAGCGRLLGSPLHLRIGRRKRYSPLRTAGLQTSLHRRYGASQGKQLRARAHVEYHFYTDSAVSRPPVMLGGAAGPERVDLYPHARSRAQVKYHNHPDSAISRPPVMRAVLQGLKELTYINMRERARRWSTTTTRTAPCRARPSCWPCCRA